MTTTNVESGPSSGPLGSDSDVDSGRPTAQARPTGHRTVLALSVAALVASLTAPYWSAPLYRFLHLRPAGLEWQARQEVETGRLGQAVAELDRRLSTLADTQAKAGEKAALTGASFAALETQARVLALLELKTALRRPVPFDSELKVVRAVSGKQPELEPLLAVIEPYAVNGILVESQLRREFAGVVDGIARVEQRNTVVGWLVNLTGWSTDSADTPPSQSDAIVGRVRARLADDDLRGAIGELAALDAPAAAVARAWLGEARARVAANEAVDRIAESVASALNRLAPRT
ncbi:hypothetical protein [Azospirillum sp. TSO35-2]|uniref:COG4223 family protein n=1 Tax=Azospirillum sp. TSO35-2 TaxID=716796 RepID=UPI000D61665B|nr:hypothetical protein [Azospirillum sp. TSO35-2]PWC31249.1 hypothetical protein TSO352_31145 [Azospirillum sp. TSO35-2]